MEAESPLDRLPVELLEMVAWDEPTHRELLAYPRYARAVDIAAVKKRFGHTVAVINGVTSHRRRGRLHRLDGPAYYGEKESTIQTTDFTLCNVDRFEYWYRNRDPHREDGPSVTFKRTERCYRDGVPHREDSPTNTREIVSHEWWRGGRQLYGVAAREAEDAWEALTH